MLAIERYDLDFKRALEDGWNALVDLDFAGRSEHKKDPYQCLDLALVEARSMVRHLEELVKKV